MDKEQGQEEKDRKEGLKVNAPPPTDGLRRSSRLCNQLPPPPPPGEGGSDRVSEMKRLRRQEDKDPRKEGADDGEAVDVKVRKVNHKPNVNVKEASKSEGDKEKGERSLSRQQLPRGVKAKVGGLGSKVKDVILKEGEASSVGNAGSGRSRSSEVRSSENAPEGRAPALESSGLVSKPPNGNDQVAVGAGANDNVRGITVASPVLEPPAALQNSVVLTNMFELCPPSDLAKFRLVCKEWRDLSLKTWRTSVTLILTRNSGNGRFYIGRGTKTTLSKFLKYVEDPGNECGGKPFRRIILGGLIFNHRKPPIIERFWHLTGNHVTSLGLHCCKFSDAEEFWRIPYIICPNLKRLCLRICSFVSGQNVDHPSEPQLKYREPIRGKHGHLKYLDFGGSQIPVSWLELLSHFDSLTSIEVHSHAEAVGETLLNAIKAVRKHDGNKLPLTNFNVEQFRITHERDSHAKFALLEELNIPLKCLVVGAHPHLNLESVTEILEAHSGSLENIVLVDETEGVRMRGKFQCPIQLEKLKDLTMLNVLLEGTEILKSAPNLEALQILVQDGQVDRLNRLFEMLADWEADSDGIVLLPKLTTLTYSYAGCSGARQNLLTLAKLMPNVDDLEMTLNDEQFSTVCELWKGLKELCVYSDGQGDANHLTDKGVTGGCLQIEKPEMTWVHKALRANITDLKELRSFRCYSNKLTDVSVYHGFLQLPNLKSVALLEGDDSDESDGEDDENPIATPTPKPNCFGHDARNALQEKGISLKLP